MSYQRAIEAGQLEHDCLPTGTKIMMGQVTEIPSTHPLASTLEGLQAEDQDVDSCFMFRIAAALCHGAPHNPQPNARPMVRAQQTVLRVLFFFGEGECANARFEVG